MVRAVRQPLLHAQEIQELVPVLADVDEGQAVFGEAAEGRHHREEGPADLARHVAEGVDHQVDLLGLQVADPHVHEAAIHTLRVRVRMEVDRRDACDQVADFFRMERGVDQRKHAALAYAEEIDRRDVVPVADDIDEPVHGDVDEIGEVVELVGGRRMAPVEHVDLAAAFGEILRKERSGCRSRMVQWPTIA